MEDSKCPKPQKKKRQNRKRPLSAFKLADGTLIVGNVIKSLEDGWLLGKLKMTTSEGTRTIEEETFIHKDAVVVYFKVL